MPYSTFPYKASAVKVKFLWVSLILIPRLFFIANASSLNVASLSLTTT